MELGVVTQNAYGMTENHSFQYTRPDDSPDTIANTCGRPCAGMEIALWREDNRDEPWRRARSASSACAARR